MSKALAPHAASGDDTSIVSSYTDRIVVVCIHNVMNQRLRCAIHTTKLRDQDGQGLPKPLKDWSLESARETGTCWRQNGRNHSINRCVICVGFAPIMLTDARP